MLEVLDAASVDGPTASAACALTLARVYGPLMEPEDEQKAVQDLMDWCYAYFVEEAQ